MDEELTRPQMDMPWLEHERALLEVMCILRIGSSHGHSLVSPATPTRRVGEIASLPRLLALAVSVSDGGPGPAEGHRFPNA